MRFALFDVTATVSIGGIQTVVWSLARELTRRGFEVSVFGGRGHIPIPPVEPVRVQTFPFLRREAIPDLGTRFRKAVERLTFGAFAFKAVVNGRFDYVFIFKPFDFPFALAVKKLSGGQIVFLSGGTDFYPMDRFFARAVDVFLSCTHFNAGQLYRRYQVYPSVVYNGVDPDLFHPLFPDPALKSRLGIEEGEFVVIYAGRLVGWKGLQSLLEALSLDVLAKRAIKCLIIGGGPEEGRLRTLSKGLNLEEKVKFLGVVPNRELPRYYALADVGIYPSIGEEAFGVSLVEAMASEVPVIATHLGGIPEVVGTDGCCGLLVAPGDSRELAEGLVRLLEEPGLRKRMGWEGRERVLASFTWEKVCTRVLDRLGIVR